MEYTNEHDQFTSEQNGFNTDEKQHTQIDSNKSGLKMNAPHANAVLTLGILSIVTCCCCNGIIGFIMSIIAIILAVKSKKEFNRNTNLYDEKSFGKVTAGKTCAIIGLIAGILMFTIAIIVVYLALDDVSGITGSVNGWDGLGY
ncbi:MAG: hypothetical protein IK025_08035 [Bacteroidales bacterium]|nr:hypothetical protein [Bacteroidales bacterium]